METREEKLAKWADPSVDRLQSLRVLSGSLRTDSNDSRPCLCISEDKIGFHQIEDFILTSQHDNVTDDNSAPDLWKFQAISFPRLSPGRLKLSFPKQVFRRIQDAWNLHPRTIEIFLSNNGVCTTFHSSSNQQNVLLKVANSRSTGFDCVSVTCVPSRRTTYALFHHLEDEASVFATLISTPERCIDPYFFVAALYRSHHQHVEYHRNTIDDAIQGIERQTGFGQPGRLANRRASLDAYPRFMEPKSVIQQLSYCQTDLAIIGHIARCSLDCGQWLIQALDETTSSVHQPQSHERGRHDDAKSRQCDEQPPEIQAAVRLMIREDVEYTRRRSAMLSSQVQQMRERVQSQTGFVSNPYLGLRDPYP
jgi:hypothetical protein